MTAGNAGLKGAPVRVDVTKPGESEVSLELLQKLNAVMVGRTVKAVNLNGDQLVFHLSDGGMVTINVAGGLREVD